jgi:hypothetical protein
MAAPKRTVRSAAPPSAPPAAPGEHIYIGSDDSPVAPAAAAKTPRSTVVLRNPIRRSALELTLFDEGYLKVTALRRGDAGAPFFLDLKFLDPIPKIERVVAVRWLGAAAGSVALAALAAFLLRFEVLRAAAGWTLGGALLAAAVALYVGVYRSHEATEFCTLHGRVRVLRFVANLGAIKRFRAVVPELSHAIEEAAERIGTDTAAYLRAEMREHYRLRGDGVLDNEECATGTGRILAQFDVRL